MSYSNTKTCMECTKKNVCKYVDLRTEMNNRLETTSAPYISGAPFSVVSSCNEFTSKTATAIRDGGLR